MDKETIRKAADESCRKNAIFDPDNAACYRQGFRDGAEWRIDEVWHDAKNEVPEPFLPLLIVCKDGIFIGKTHGVLLEACPSEWKKWAYIKDLLPDGKEAKDE